MTSTTLLTMVTRRRGAGQRGMARRGRHCAATALVLLAMLTAWFGGGPVGAAGGFCPGGGSAQAFAWGNGATGATTFSPSNGASNFCTTATGMLGLPPGVAIDAVAAGSFHSLALRHDGTVYAWGNNAYGQLGNGTVGTPAERVTPLPVIGLPLPAVAIAAGELSGLALLADGTLYAWGSDTGGMLGDGTVAVPASRATPQKVCAAPLTILPDGTCTPLTGIAAIAAGDYHSLALTATGTVYAWGVDTAGQLGDGTVSAPTARALPIAVVLPGGHTVKRIAAGGDVSLAVFDDDTLYAWGENNYGQLGLGFFNSRRATPQPVTGLPVGVAVTAIAVGETHTLAAVADGRLYAWGAGGSGQLGGDNCPAPGNTNNYCPSSGDRATPQRVPDTDLHDTSNIYLPSSPSNKVVAVAAGKGLSAGTFSLAVLQDGSVYAWGSNNYGQLGHGGSTIGGAPQGSPDHFSYGYRPRQVGGFGTSHVTAVAAGGKHSLAIVGTP